MNRFVLPAVYICLVVADKVNWGVSGMHFKNSTNGTSNKLIKEARKNFDACAKFQINFIELLYGINAADGPNRDVDTVFKNYCKKSPDFKDCVLNFISTVYVCLEEDEKEILQNVTEASLSFMCYDEGSRITFFHSQGGNSCLKDTYIAILHCLDISFSPCMPSGKTNSNNLTEFKFEEELCKSMSQLQSCVVAEFDKCDSLKMATPANMIDALFIVACRSIPCSKCNSAYVSVQSMISVIALSGLAFLLGFFLLIQLFFFFKIKIPTSKAPAPQPNHRPTQNPTTDRIPVLRHSRPPGQSTPDNSL